LAHCKKKKVETMEAPQNKKILWKDAVPPMDLFGAQLMAKVWLNSHFDQRA
jgi:hypothetical protein